MAKRIVWDNLGRRWQGGQSCRHVSAMSPNVGACLQGVAAPLTPNSVPPSSSVLTLGIHKIGLLMSLLCCQPEWTVVEFPKWVGEACAASPTQLPLTHFVWQRLAGCPRALPLVPNKAPSPSGMSTGQMTPPPSPGMRHTTCCYEGSSTCRRELPHCLFNVFVTINLFHFSSSSVPLIIFQVWRCFKKEIWSQTNFYGLEEIK